MSPDEEARKRQRLVEIVSGTVAAIALALGLKIWGRGVEKHWLEELRSSGYVGAAEAARAYNFDSETPFEGFAWPRIAGAMIDFLRKERVKLPPGLAAALEKAAAGIEVIAEYAIQVRDKGGDDLGEETEGAAAVVGVGLLCMGAGARDPLALLLREERRAQTRRAISHLAERDRAMVTLRHFEGMKIEEIAEHFRIHPETARKWLKDAMRRLGALLRPFFLGG